MKKRDRFKIIRYRFGRWKVEIMPDDGGRLRRLAYRRHNLLTLPPRLFRPPRHDYGLYEQRPVYGYDDCFPTVDPCWYPAGNIKLPDHGEVCWLKADCLAYKNGLKCVFISRQLPVIFVRQMVFKADRLLWIFSVINLGRKTLPFLHVMHPLLPLSKISKIDLPDFAGITDELNRKKMNLHSAVDVEKFLYSSPPGLAHMFLLRGLKRGFFRVWFQSGLMLKVGFKRKLFSTLGIWWNRSGYPAEKGLERDECALEPIPGAWSSLARAYQAGKYLSVPPGRTFNWRIEWQVENI